jgi:hypothetical protein
MRTNVRLICENHPVSKQPLKRIYFDTNILFRWPNLPNNVASLFGVANWVGANLYIPKTVEDELEGQFVRGANAAWDAMASDMKELTKLCNQVIAVDVQGNRPHDDDLRAAFRTRSKQLKSSWRIENIPIHEVDLATLLEMAINRDAPFEEVEINKSKYVVTGLQDTAILFAIASHMKTADRDERCALISNDGVFQGNGCRDFPKMADVKLEMFRSVDVLFRDLFDHVWAAVRAGWDEEMKQVEVSLNQQKEVLQAQIVPLLNISKMGGSMWKTTIELKEFEIVEFRDVKTELPPTDHRPPNTAAYKRPDGSRVQVSARASANVVALTENWNLLGLFSGYGKQGPEPTKTIETNAFSESINLSIDGTVSNGVVGNFKVTAAEVVR